MGKYKNPLQELSASVNNPKKDYSKYIEQFNQRFNSLANERRPYERRWKELRDLLLPHTGRALGGEKNNKNEVSYDKIITGFVKKCANTLAAGLHSAVTPKSRPWFRLQIKDKKLAQRHSVKVWLKQVEEMIFDDLRRSKFYETAYMGFLHAVVYGTFVCGIFESPKKVITSKALDIGEFYLGVDEDGDLDTVCRDMYLTTTQLIERFGEKNVSVEVLNDYKQGQNLDKTHHVRHIVCSNRYPEMVSKLFAYASVYYMNDETKHALAIEGFNEMPYQIIAWTQEGNYVYGVSPAMDTLCNNKMLQKQQSLTIKSEDKLVNPPMIYDSQMRGFGVHDYPGGINYVDNLIMNGKSPVYPLGGMPANLDFHLRSKEETKSDIKEAFFVDMFLMMMQVEAGKMTATEVVQRNQEKLMMLGPISDSFQRNFLIPSIERVYAIHQRYEMLPPIPDDLDGQRIEIDFISLMAQAQKSTGLNEMTSFISIVGGLAQTNPAVLDKVAFDKLVDKLAHEIGIDPSILVSEDDVNKVRQMRAQQQQQAQMVESMPTMARGAKDFSEAQKVAQELNKEQEGRI